MTSSNVLFVGTPSTGKSTYLALLNLAVTDQKKTTMTLGNFGDDREYLNILARQLFRCEVAERTEVGQTNGLSLSVSLANGSEIVLNVPDLSGEVWKDLLLERHWDRELQEAALAASGICIFVNATTFRNDLTIAEADRNARAIGESPGSLDEDANKQFAQPGFQSGQVQLTDLLQIVGKQYGRPARHISIVISAFDTVRDASPRKWIEVEAPLVHQYLSNDLNGTAVRVFGVSAQGGSFDDAPVRESLLKEDPLLRAFVMGDDGTIVDIDEPVLWALSAI